MEYTFEHVFNTISASCQQVGPIHQFSLHSFSYLWRHSIHVLSTRFMHFYNMFSATMKLQTSYLMFLSLSPGPSSSSRSWFKSYPTSNFKNHNSCGHASVDWGGGEGTLCAHFCDSQFQFLPSYPSSPIGLAIRNKVQNWLLKPVFRRTAWLHYPLDWDYNTARPNKYSLFQQNLNDVIRYIFEYFRVTAAV